jgi:hypothetical protein
MAAPLLFCLVLLQLLLQLLLLLLCRRNRQAPLLAPAAVVHADVFHHTTAMLLLLLLLLNAPVFMLRRVRCSALMSADRTGGKGQCHPGVPLKHLLSSCRNLTRTVLLRWKIRHCSFRTSQC